MSEMPLLSLSGGRSFRRLGSSVDSRSSDTEDLVFDLNDVSLEFSDDRGGGGSGGGGEEETTDSPVDAIAIDFLPPLMEGEEESEDSSEESEAEGERGGGGSGGEKIDVEREVEGVGEIRPLSEETGSCDEIGDESRCAENVMHREPAHLTSGASEHLSGDQGSVVLLGRRGVFIVRGSSALSAGLDSEDLSAIGIASASVVTSALCDFSRSGLSSERDRALSGDVADDSVVD